MRYDPFSNVAGSKKMTHPHEIGPPNHNCSMLAGPLVRTVDHWYVQWYVSACAQCKKTRSAEFAHFKLTVLGFYPKKHEVLKLPKSRGTRAPVPCRSTNTIQLCLDVGLCLYACMLGFHLHSGDHHAHSTRSGK